MMRNSYNIILLSFLLSCYLCNLVISQGTARDSYSSRLRTSRSFSCLQAGNASVSFRNNVNILLPDFNQQSSRIRYYNTSIGNSSPNRVYGYYMCRSDITIEVCHSCILNGTQFAIQADCDQVEGTYFAELCIFRYSDHSMYRLWENTVAVSDYIEANVSNYQQFNRTMTTTLEDVINEGARLGFATHEADVSRDETIYSMAQCTPDIVGVNCSRCLRSASSILRDGAPAGFATMNKCYLRYDNVSFYDIGGQNVNTGVGLRSSNLLAVVYSVLFLIVYKFIVLL